jgi:transcriptional regulator with XRE-family HTH domain
MKRKLAERIAQVRGDRSQRQFARDLGVFQQNVNRYESGTPHADFLIALWENVSLDWLLLGKEDAPQRPLAAPGPPSRRRPTLERPVRQRKEAHYTRPARGPGLPPHAFAPHRCPWLASASRASRRGTPLAPA